jgi:hypothetical protein
MNEWANGNNISDSLYPARQIIGYPLAYLHNITGISLDMLYIVFCFVSLALTGYVLYKIFSKFNVGKEAFVLSVCCSTGILSMFSYGMVASILNMYVFMVGSIYFLIEWITKSKKKHLAIGLLLFGIFSIFHLTSLYAPYAIVILIVVTLLSKLFNKSVSIKKPLIVLALLTGMLVLNVILALAVFTPSIQGMAFNNIVSFITGNSSMYLSNTPLSINFFVLRYLSIATIGVLIISLITLFLYRKKTVFSKEWCLYIIALTSFAVPLCVGTFFPVSPEPVRTAVDFATVTALITALLFSIVKKESLVKVTSYAFMGYGLLGSFITWVK